MNLMKLESSKSSRSKTLNIGLISPKYSIGWNTDLKIQSYLSGMSNNDTLKFIHCGGYKYSLSFILEQLIKRLTKYTGSFCSLSSRDFQKFDYFYCYGYVPDELNRLISCSSRKALFTTGYMTPNFLGSKERIEKQIAKMSYLDAHIDQSIPFRFHTQYGAKNFQSFNSCKRKVISIPFFLPYLENYIPVKAQNNINIAFIGRDGERKGLYVLLEALKTLSETCLSRKKIVIYIVSKSKPIIVPGVTIKWLKYARPEIIKEILCKSHILAMPVLRESYGIVFVEAMAAKCSILADSDFPRNEILNNCGLHVNSSKVTQVANAINDLINDKSLSDALASRAYSRYSKIYHPLVVMKSYAKIFNNLAFN